MLINKYFPWATTCLLLILGSLVILQTRPEVLAETKERFDSTVRDMPTVALDSKNNLYIAWREYTDPEKTAIVLQKIGFDGTREWSSEKTLITPHALVTEFVHLTGNFEDSLSLVWATYTPGDQISHYFLQKFDTSGIPLWSTPLNFYNNTGQEPFYNAADVSIPQIDLQGNTHLAWTERTDSQSQLRYQIISDERIPKWSAPLMVQETKNVNALQFYFLDLDIDAKEKAAYLTYLSIHAEDLNAVGYNIVKVDFDGNNLWERSFRIPVNDDEFPSFINFPTLNDHGFLHFGWGIKEGETGFITQYYKQMFPDGSLSKEQSVKTKRQHFIGLRSTRIVSPRDNTIIFATSLKNTFDLYRYTFGEDELSEKHINLERIAADRHYGISNWSIVPNAKDDIFLVWSEHEFNEKKEAGNYNIFAQKFSPDLAKMWGVPEKANSKRIAVSAPKSMKQPKSEKKRARPLSIDSDNDGLSDEQEISTYFTDPFHPDTDSDGYLDGEEVTKRFNPTGICRKLLFQTGEFAYGRGKLLDADNETCRKNYLSQELAKLLTEKEWKALGNKQFDIYTNAFIYGEYPLSAIASSIRHGHTVHPSIPWSLWRTTREYQQYINR